MTDISSGATAAATMHVITPGDPWAILTATALRINESLTTERSTRGVTAEQQYHALYGVLLAARANPTPAWSQRLATLSTEYCTDDDWTQMLSCAAALMVTDTMATVAPHLRPH